MLTVGDRVQWTHVSASGRSISMSLREGVIESFIGSGAFAIVKKRSGRRDRIKTTNLQPLGEKSGVANFMDAMIEANRKRGE